MASSALVVRMFFRQETRLFLPEEWFFRQEEWFFRQETRLFLPEERFGIQLVTRNIRVRDSLYRFFSGIKHQTCRIGKL